MQTQQIVKSVIGGILGLIVFCVLLGCFYTVDEGNVGIIKRFGEARDMEQPGLHFKLPFVDSVTEIEVRTRKNVESMPSASKEQMPIVVQASVNWTIDAASGLVLYKKYGSLEQFESRILDTRFRAAVKGVVPAYTAEELVQDRSKATALIEQVLIDSLADFPVKVDSVQIENIELPKTYLDSIQTKQTEKNLADAENHKLRRQGLTAQQAVNTAAAERDAAMARADGNAYQIEAEAKAEAASIRVKGTAEADAIREKSEALKNSPLLVELTKAQRWDGTLPSTVMGDQPGLLMNMNK